MYNHSQLELNRRPLSALGMSRFHEIESFFENLLLLSKKKSTYEKYVPFFGDLNLFLPNVTRFIINFVSEKLSC